MYWNNRRIGKETTKPRTLGLLGHSVCIFRYFKAHSIYSEDDGTFQKAFLTGICQGTFEIVLSMVYCRYGGLIKQYEILKRLLLRCIHHFESDLINNITVSKSASPECYILLYFTWYSKTWPPLFWHYATLSVFYRTGPYNVVWYFYQKREIFI